MTAIDLDAVYRRVRAATDAKLSAEAAGGGDAWWIRAFDAEERAKAALEARGDWEDQAAERVDCHVYDPDEDRPHAGGTYWDRLLSGEAL